METPKKTYSKQGGRPKVGIGRICKYVVSTRLSPERKLRFSALCREAGQPPAEVLRQLIDRGTVRARITREQLDFMAQLKGIARNLNQLTRLANSTGKIENAQLAEASRIMQRIWQFMQEKS